MTLPTWNDLVTKQPALAEIEREIRSIDATNDPAFCANFRWYGYRKNPSFKQDMMELVGKWAITSDPDLKSSEAYDVAYQHLYNLLPDCRHEGMCGPNTSAPQGHDAGTQEIHDRKIGFRTPEQ